RSVKRYGEIRGNVGTETRPRNVAFNYIVRAA
ncbi:phage tail protein, partial [Escherichia coli]